MKSAVEFASEKIDHEIRPVNCTTQEAIDWLEELREEINIRLDALKEDLGR